MRRQHKLWTTISEELYAALKNYGEEIGIKTRTKTVLYILFHFKPDKIIDDYQYQAAKSKNMVLNLTDMEYDKFLEFEEKFNGFASKSQLLRAILYTFFKEEEKI